MSRFRPIDRQTDYLLPPSVQEWLPETHLARYVVDVVEALDLSALERAYAGRGSDAYHPAMLLSLLIYGYATGTHSSRRIERATYDSLAFRFIACNQHPDHDTLASFRRRFGEQFAELFVQVLQVARENQLSRFGTVSLDGTKLHANASRHSALSYGHAQKIEAQLKAEVQEMLKLADEEYPIEVEHVEDVLYQAAGGNRVIGDRGELTPEMMPVPPKPPVSIDQILQQLRASGADAELRKQLPDAIRTLLPLLELIESELPSGLPLAALARVVEAGSGIAVHKYE